MTQAYSTRHEGASRHFFDCLLSPANGHRRTSNPFNDPNDSVDLVIRTSDNVDDLVLSGLLSLRSPWSFFRHALQSSRHTEERDGLPVLRVEDNSATFRYILLLFYPNERPVEIESIEDVSAVGVALKKYCVDYAIGRFEKTVIVSSLMREQALRLFVFSFP
ncbi:uncharacterized protein BT62DRAFT_926115 [Guyanagaster necrorhizus]|uniref:BTB domain-containing protein n=1 Tax=Guyanagaster necrorhizus TaxID=856835 RepID=A0A9P7W3E7_9AGAR|nr:uncharacterized protein BT62DRAFT_926115 [Guyanagaster necrorhizus MCA 3950]KAG7451922.1 hypothetical protein BT62DRAFT_926115 [Guyanagaster necrorhizus MCA 3950]